MSKLDNPQAGADKWATAMASAGPAYTAGVQGVTTAPGQLAARASAKYLARVQANVAKFERNVGQVSLTSWQQSAENKGAPRLGTGAAAAKPKFVAFNTAFYAYLKNGQATINAMPTDTIDQSIAKAVAQMNYNHNFPGYTRP